MLHRQEEIDGHKSNTPSTLELADTENSIESLNITVSDVSWAGWKQMPSSQDSISISLKYHQFPCCSSQQHEFILIRTSHIDNRGNMDFSGFNLN